MPFLAIEFWRHADDFLECAAEVIGVFKADAASNLGERERRVDEHALSLADAAAQDVLLQGVIRDVLEQMRDVVFAGMHVAGNVTQGDRFGVMCFDELFNRGDEVIVFFLGRYGICLDQLMDDEDDGAGQCVGNRIPVRQLDVMMDHWIEFSENVRGTLAGNPGMHAFWKQGIDALPRQFEVCYSDAPGIHLFFEHHALIMQDMAVVDQHIARLRIADLAADDMCAIAAIDEIELDTIFMLMHGAAALMPVVDAAEFWFLLKW